MPPILTAANRIWKVPVGVSANLAGVSGLHFILSDLEDRNLYMQATNSLRQFKLSGEVVWGSRTAQGSNQGGSQWQYVPIRRVTPFLESSLDTGSQWVVFEPNNEPPRGQIRLNVRGFLEGLVLQGAFQGTTPQQAYFLNCNVETISQSNLRQGVIRIAMGFTPLVPLTTGQGRHGRVRLVGFEVLGRSA